jgi:dienelactone hydrolase
MMKNICIALSVVFAIVICSCAAKTLNFKAKSTTLYGDPVVLTGKLTKPQGDGPFPAVVLLHACRGPMPEYEEPWVERLTSWGYVTFRVDSHGPRGDPSVCIKLLAVPPWTRAQDAHDAKAYLANFPFVDTNRIAVMGSGTGAWAALYAVNKSTAIEDRGEPFQAAVALYPLCSVENFEPEAEIMVLIGEVSEFFPAEKCSEMMKNKEVAPYMTLKIYPGAKFGFDMEMADKIKTMGDKTVKYDPAASADAIVRIKEFLSKHLEKPLM